MVIQRKTLEHKRSTVRSVQFRSKQGRVEIPMTIGRMIRRLPAVRHKALQNCARRTHSNRFRMAAAPTSLLAKVAVVVGVGAYTMRPSRAVMSACCLRVSSLQEYALLCAHRIRL